MAKYCPEYCQPRDYDHLFKVLIIGNSGVGKSALLVRFADNVFSTNFITTVGVDFRIHTFNVDGEKIKLQVWDTAGQERFRTITSTYYRATHGVIVVYDVTNGESFVSVKRWLQEIETHCDEVSKILVGNKNDDPSRKVVLFSDAQHFANQMSIPIMEASAKDNVGVHEAFVTIARLILSDKKKQQVEDTKRQGFQVRSTPSQKSKGSHLAFPRKKNSCC